MRVYKVGGAVRDKLLGLPFKDSDWVVVGATVEEMLARKYMQVGRDFPVFLHPETKEEYALARTERKSGKGYTGFVVHASPDVTLEDDLKRRDLTINTLAETADGELVDLYGGRADLDARILRHVSPAFAEDPLRVLRVARFAARFAHLGFTVAPGTLELMTTMTAAGELEHLVPERVWQEIHTALVTQTPRVFFEVLRACGALHVILPELDRLFGVPQPEKYHPEADTGMRALMVLQRAASLTPNPTVRFAVLVHEAGAAVAGMAAARESVSETASASAPVSASASASAKHNGRTAEAIARLAERLRVPNEFSELATMVCLHHQRCHDACRHSPADLFLTLELSDALRRADRFELFLLACEADALGRHGLEQQAYPQSVLLRQVLAVARKVDIKSLVAAHIDPRTLAPAIRQARIDALAAAGLGA
jgi:tRNA nucleotidyltransferase (CCA-adding enzyme)